MAKLPIADAFDIQEGTIFTIEDGAFVPHGYVSNVTIDNKRPEDFVNIIGGQVRRRKPEETDWSCDSVVLYNNLDTLKRLENQKFSIQIKMVDPLSGQNGDPIVGQILTIEGCRIADQNITISDGSTFKMSGRADAWTISAVTA